MADELDTISNHIERLGDSAINLQTLSSQAMRDGDPAKAQDLATQAMLMMGKKAELRARRRDLEATGDQWRNMLDKLDDLDQKASEAKANMHKAEDTVEAAKTVLGVVGKILTVL